jgi:SpoVK/Ycf46/Vps4 family AAA+-type ATPase
LIFREGLLQNAAIYFNGFDALFNQERANRQIFEHIIAGLKKYPLWAFLSGEKEWQPKTNFDHKPFFSIEVSTASYLERMQSWAGYKENAVKIDSEVNLIDLAGKFKFTSGQIEDAITMARNQAKWRDPENTVITKEDLYAACRQQSTETLSSLAHKIYPTYQWGDIVLPQDQKNQLREIANYVVHYHKVYNDWGFGSKISTGKGLNVLFAGSSGTGKTMAAEIIAHELGIDLYKIDLSGIVSKYIGETEKNLDQIFKSAQTSNVILFFDEADALFGKRSEVRDSHDRYANIEVAYLLQKMDDYEGIVILATNLRKNMDDAFARRMHYTLEFPVPEEDDRFRIWQNIFPQDAPLSDSLDLKFMAKQFKITGGNIKNIALSAAFLAAQSGGVIETEHLIQSTRREYLKMGKLCTEGEFARYFDMVKS